MNVLREVFYANKFAKNKSTLSMNFQKMVFEQYCGGNIPISLVRTFLSRVSIHHEKQNIKKPRNLMDIPVALYIHPHFLKKVYILKYMV